MDAFVLDTSTLRDLAPDVIAEPGIPRVMPAAYYADTSPEDRAWLGHRHALYGLPTNELCDWLTKHIAGRSALEIGAGNGAMAAHIGIRATDSYLQEKVKAHWDDMGQPRVTYGPNVERLEATRAVRKYKPQVVVGCWVEHRYDARHHSRGGNQYGPKLDEIFKHCEEYILIGNSSTHRKHPALGLPHTSVTPDWLYSRTITGTANFIAVWTT